MPARNRRELSAQEPAGDVDRDVLRRLQRFEESLGLGAVAGAEVDQRAARADLPGELVGIPVEDHALVARQRVLGQFADRLEEPRTEGVVEELGRDRGQRRSEARAQLDRGVGGRREQVEEAHA